MYMQEEPQYNYYHEPQYQPPRPAEYYDTDCGNKASLARSVETSTRRYAIMGSKCPRFKDTHSCAPAADYNIDHLHKKGVSASVRESKQKYAASFSRTARWGKAHKILDTPDKYYETDFGPSATLYKKCQENPQTYAIMRSKFSRFGPKPGIAPPTDVDYNTDVLNKASLETVVGASNQRYSVMRSRQPRLRMENTFSSGDLGPGAYDTPCLLDMRRDWTARAQSSFVSAVPRLKVTRDPTKNLGSTWTPEHDRKVWQDKGNKFSTAAITRPSYLPEAYDEKKPKK